MISCVLGGSERRRQSFPGGGGLSIQAGLNAVHGLPGRLIQQAVRSLLHQLIEAAFQLLAFFRGHDRCRCQCRQLLAQRSHQGIGRIGRRRWRQQRLRQRQGTCQQAGRCQSGHQPPPSRRWQDHGCQQRGETRHPSRIALLGRGHGQTVSAGQEIHFCGETRARRTLAHHRRQPAERYQECSPGRGRHRPGGLRPGGTHHGDPRTGNQNPGHQRWHADGDQPLQTLAAGKAGEEGVERVHGPRSVTSRQSEREPRSSVALPQGPRPEPWAQQAQPEPLLLPCASIPNS